MGTESEKTKIPRPTKAEMAEWNARLGMGEEPGEDLGAKAMREVYESEHGVNDSDKAMIKALRSYFIYRSGANPAEHKQAARGLAEEAGISLEGLSMDVNELVEQVRDEMEALDHAMSRIALKLKNQNPRLLRDARRFASEIVLEYNRGEAPTTELDDDTVYGMADRVASTVAGF